TKPGPWVTWQELSPTAGGDQIYAVRPIGPGAANCDGVTPAGVPVAGHVPATGGFCFQQTGIPRVAGSDPSLNVDTSRNAVEPDIAFTGANDGVPWIVWYEKDSSGNELHENEMVFAAKGVSDGEGANGGFGSGASAHFELANGGAPISTGTGDASRPDITFSGNTPYVSWRQDVGGGTVKGFTGHFANPATFVQDQGEVPLTPTAQAEVREPI